MKTYILAGFVSGFVAAVLFLAICVVINRPNMGAGVYCSPAMTVCITPN